MSRTTLDYLADEIRSMVMLSETEFTIGTANFWDNDQIQNILEDNRIDILREELQKIPTYIGGGSVQYYEYRSQFQFLEKTSGGSAIFIIEDSVGANVGTASWSADYRRGVITFTSDQGGTAYYLTARRYRIYNVAAEIARRTANYYAKSYDISTDGHRLNRSQLRDHFEDMAKRFEMNSEVETWEFGV